MNTDTQVAGAKLVGGVWLPATEHHFEKMMVQNTKNHRRVDGKLTYQYRKLEAAMQMIPADRRRTCLDIGAHVGLWAMWLVKEFEHVHCFEPVPLHRAILPHNMPTDNYTVHAVALGSEAGTVNIVVPQGVTGNAHVVPPGTVQAPDYAKEPQVCGVEMVTLDSMFFAVPIDFIKIDVEGFELEVLKGARETLLKNKPYMVLEQKGNDAKFFNQPKLSGLTYAQSLGMKIRKEIGGDYLLGW